MSNMDDIMGTLSDVDGNRWELKKLRAVPDNDPANYFVRDLKWKQSDLPTLEIVTEENTKEYRRVPTLWNFWTDGKLLYKQELLWKWVKYYDKDTGDYRCSNPVVTGKKFWKERTDFQVKERLYNSQPTLFWINHLGIMIPVGVITATGFLGPKPAGHRLEYIDGDFTNTSPVNLRWVLKTKTDGSVRYVSYDKSKKKWRVTAPNLSRKCFKTQDEAVAWLKSQQVVIQYLDNTDNYTDPGIFQPECESSEEDEIVHV